MVHLPERKGWCPGFHAPMQSRDGWLVRFSPDFEGLTSSQLGFLADRALAQGNGRVTLTQRGNLQLRGFSERDARHFPVQAARFGLGDPNPDIEAYRRLLFVSPLAGYDPDCSAETAFLAREIQQKLRISATKLRPPEKFSIAVDGGGLVPVGSLRADIMVQARNGLWSIQYGTSRLDPHRGKLVETVMALLAQSSRPEEGRVRALYRAPPCMETRPALLGEFLPGLWGVKAQLGEISAQTCTVLARTGATVRVTPWHGLVLQVPVRAPDLIETTEDPRYALAACPGSEGCAQGQVNSRLDALFLASSLMRRSLHVSGCAKGCASRHVTDVTLVGHEGRYDLIWQGRVSDMPTETGLTREDVRMRLLMGLGKETGSS